MSANAPETSISRRAFLKAAAALAVLWPALPALAAVRTAPLRLPRPARMRTGAMALEDLVGERLNYDIGFWVFSRAGTVHMTLQPLERTGLYEASLVAQTSGVIGFFTRYRKDVYHSAMEVVGGRLRPREFREEVVIGKEVKRRRTTIFDYAGRVIHRRKDLGRGGVEVEDLAMQPGLIYDDYLSGIYNLRLGAYGPLRPGASFSLNMPKKKDGLIRVELAGAEEARRALSQEHNPAGKIFYSRIFMSKEALGSGNGKLEGWFSADAVPLAGVVEDVALFGDISGTLQSRDILPPGRKQSV